MTTFVDLASLPEDERIDIMGQRAAAGHVVGFVVETNAKADRYLRKLRTRHRVQLIDRGPGPVARSILVRIGPIPS